MLLLLIPRAFSASLQANTPRPSIFKIFEKYGNQKGVTMLEVSSEIIKSYNIKHFKSIVFDDGRYALADIRKCIEKDKFCAKKMKELIQNGEIVSAYYRLQTENESMNRYLIFKVSKQYKTTLIYIEGALSPDELVELLK